MTDHDLPTDILLQTKIMKNQSPKKLPEKYLYQDDPRTETQKILSIRITRILSQINLTRIRKQQNSNLNQKIDQNLFYFICLCGMPPLEGQFQNLDLPGEKIVVPMYGFGEFTEKQYLQNFHEANFDKFTEYIRKIVEEQSVRKKVVLVYHSFGSYEVFVYFQHFPQDHKISGIIDIGGAPIRFYPMLIQTISPLLGFQNQVMLQNRQYVFSQYTESYKNGRINLIRNSFQTIIFLKYVLQKQFEKMFQYSRQLPDILKLIICGQQDDVFSENLLAQKIIYYSQLRKFPEQLNLKLKQNYEKCFGEQCNNIQQRFCISVPEAKHSLHMQKKFGSDIRQSIYNYLYLLQSCFL